MSIFQLFSLENKNAIITGATGGIGVAMTVALAEAGADIVSIQMPNDPLGAALEEKVRATGRKFTVFESNLKDHKSIQETFAAIWGSGVVGDILLNCAGITRHEKMENTSIEDLDDVMSINFRAAYLVSQEFGKRLLSLERPGKIIHIASMASYIAQTDISVYASSKAALRNLTKAISNEWAGKGIQCNCISPGFIQTAMSKALWTDPEFSAKVVARTSAGRWGFPDDLRGVVVFLASRASDFITGESIVVDGGVLGR